MSDMIDRQAALDTEGLDEQIRCEMCRNPMHTDRGCDGNCKYDEKLYERIMQILGERIKPLPSVQSDVPDTNVGDLISRQAAIDAECEVCQIAPKKERGHNCTYYVHGCKEIECLRAVPSAQSEIIRCKNCTRYEKKSGRCNLVEGLNVATANSFCSYGEKK